MRKVLLSITLTLAVFCAGNVFAQTTEIYYPDGTIASGDTIKFSAFVDSTDFDQEIINDEFVHIVNISNDTNTYMLRRIEHKIINGSQDMMCWGGLCFIGPMAGVDSVWAPRLDSLIMGPGDTAGTVPGTYGLKIYFLPNGLTGQVLYEYQVYNINDMLGADYSSVYVQYDLSFTTSIEKHQLANYDLSIYPNPVSDIVNIDIDFQSNVGNYSIVVRDILGKDIERKEIALGTQNVKIDMSNYSKGLYFVSLMNQQEVLKTKKLIVK